MASLQALSTDGILAALTASPLDPLVLPAVLTSVLRSLTASGRSTRAVVRAVAAIAASSEPSAAVRVTAYEILWNLVAAVDSGAYAALVGLASNDMLSADHPDLSVAALATLASLPAYLSAPLLLRGDEVERSMGEAMTGDAPTHIRVASVRTFTRMAFTAMMLSQSATPENGGVFGLGLLPAESRAAFDRNRNRLFDKGMEVLKTTTNCCEDANVEVAGAAFAALRYVIDAAPVVTTACARGATTLTSVSPLICRYACMAGTTLPLQDTIVGQGCSEGLLAAALVPPHARIVREVCKRVAARLGYIMNRLAPLRYTARAHAIRAITLLLAHIAMDSSGGGTTGPLDAPTVVRMDHLSPAADPHIHHLMHEWMTVHLKRVLLSKGALLSSGYGGPGTLSSSLSAEVSPAVSELGSGPGAALVLLEAVRALVQVGMTWGPALTTRPVARRIAAARCAVVDLLAVTPSGSQHGASASLAVGAVAGLVGTSLANGTANGLGTGSPVSMQHQSGGLETQLGLLGDAFSSIFSGPLWSTLGVSRVPTLAAASPLATAVSAAFYKELPTIMSTLFTLLRRVTSNMHTSGASAGPVVATAGLLNPTPGMGAESLHGPVSATGAPLAPNDPAVLAAAGAQVSAGNGIASGPSSPLTTEAFLHRLLLLLTSALTLAPTTVLISHAPAVIREVGRLSDDIVDDVGAGFHHNCRRVGLLMYLWGAVQHSVLEEAAPHNSLEPYVGGQEGGMRSPPGEALIKSPVSTRSMSMLPQSTRASQQAGGPGTPTGPRRRSGVASRANSGFGGGPGPGTPAASVTGGGGPAASPLSSSPLPTLPPPAARIPHSLILAKIAFEATRPLAPAFPDSMSASAGVLNALAGLSAGGDVHATEVATTSTRYRCEVGSTLMQSLTRATPTGALLGRLTDVARGTDTSSPLTVHSRVQDAEAVHVWLTAAMDTIGAYMWLVEHRLSYCGIATMSRDQAAGTLAKIIGQPDAPAPSPAPITHSPPSSLYADAELGGALFVDSSSKTGVSTAGGSAGVGFVTGWAWIREYESCVEATETFMNLLAAVAAVLHPPPLPSTYGALTQAGHTSPGCALSTALALDLLPPALLALHRTRLSRIFLAASKADCGIYRMYELERAVAATAPKIAAAAASAVANHSLTSSVTRGSSYDVLPSAVPLQLRLLWLLSSVWDGTDGITSSAGVGGGVANLLGQSAQTATHAGASTTSSVTALVAVGSAPGVSGLAVSATDAMLRHATLAPSSLQSALKEVLSRAGAKPPLGASSRALTSAGSKGVLAMALTAEETTSLAVEALRQKRLAALVGTIAGEAGIALGLGTDLEGAGTKAMAVLAAISAGATVSFDAHETPSRSSAPTPTRGGKDTAPSGSPPSAPTDASWLRGSKIGRALGFFGATPKRDTSAIAQAVVYTGEKTVVMYAHFWLLLDMLSQLAASQRCCAGQVKRATECMLVQPKLADDVGETLIALLPRLSLFCAAYGRSSVAKELAVLDTATGGSATAASARGGGMGGYGSALGSQGAALRVATSSATILSAVAAEAALAARDPWSFTHFNPSCSIGTTGRIRDASKDPVVASALSQLSQFRRLVGSSDANSSKGGPRGASGSNTTTSASALEVMADMLSPPTAALIAAAAAPDLTQNVTLGLNRSAATGARMRTATPVSLAHANDVGAWAAAFAMCRGQNVEEGASGGGGSSAAASHMRLPAEYVGSVPMQLAAALQDAQARLEELDTQKAAGGGTSPLSRRIQAAVALGATPQARASRCLNALVWPDTGRPLDDVLLLECLAFPPAAATASTTSSRALQPGVGAGSGSGSQWGGAPMHVLPPLSLAPSLEADGLVVTASSDPICIILRHTPHPALARVVLNVRLVNNSSVRVPSGLKVGLQLSGPLMFDRGAVTSSQVASSSVRLGSASTGNAPAMAGLGMGAASTGNALQGDFITMQRGSCSHATLIVSRPLPPGFELSYDVVFSVVGFGSACVRPTLTFENVELMEGDEEGDLPPGAVAASRVGRAVGATSGELHADDDDDEDVDWSRLGSGQGGVNAPWATDLAPASLSAAGDGLIWSGADLNVVRKGRLLGGTISPQLAISRVSANKPATAAPSQLSSAFSSVGEAVMRGWSGRDRDAGSSPSTSQRGVTGKERRSSGVSSMIGSGGGFASGDRDDTDSVPGGGGDDDAASVGSSGTGLAGTAEFDLEAGAGSSGSVAFRPFRIRRIELTAQAYRIPAFSTFMSAWQVRLPPALSIALAVGVDVLPGAASAFGFVGAPSLLAAAAIEGGGMSTAALVSGAALASANGSVISIANALFAGVMARLPYPHYAVLTSQPFNAVAAATGTGRGTRRELSLRSPAWIAGIFCEGLGPQWSRLPMPLNPALPPVARQRGLMDVAQVALTSSTWAGSTVAIFVTAMLVSCEAAAAATHPFDTPVFGYGGNPPTPATEVEEAPPTTALWQVAVQLRADDARVRAAFSVEFPEFMHSATCGRLSVLSHGNAPAPQSILQQVDSLITRDLEGEDDATIFPGSTSSVATATQAASLSSKLGIGILPLTALAVGRELASSGQHELASTRNALGTSIFTVIPQDLLDMLSEAALGYRPGGHPSEEGLDATKLDAAARELMEEEVGIGIGIGMSSPSASTAASASGGRAGVASMRLDDFFASGGSGSEASSASVTQAGTAKPTLPAAGAGYDPFQ